jgi:hypothetical protein
MPPLRPCSQFHLPHLFNLSMLICPDVISRETSLALATRRSLPEKAGCLVSWMAMLQWDSEPACHCFKVQPHCLGCCAWTLVMNRKPLALLRPAARRHTCQLELMGCERDSNSSIRGKPLDSVSLRNTGSDHWLCIPTQASRSAG